MMVAAVLSITRFFMCVLYACFVCLCCARLHNPPLAQVARSTYHVARM